MQLTYGISNRNIWGLKSDCSLVEILQILLHKSYKMMSHQLEKVIQQSFIKLFKWINSIQYYINL